MGKASLYFHTISRMKPSMIVARLKGTKKLCLARLDMSKALKRNAHILMPQTDLASRYLVRFDADALLNGEILLINERYSPDFSVWQVPEASHLWNFNLHYFEYCISLGAKWRDTGDNKYWVCFKRLVNSWIEACSYGEGDAWHPYTISLRLVNWLVCRDLFSEVLVQNHAFDCKMQQSMYLQYRHLLVNQEKHLLANHYFENLKTLVVCALFFGENDVFARVERDFFVQLDEQILPDGVHYERSMMYHKLILEGLLRVELAYRSVGKQAPVKVVDKVKQMLDAIASIEKGMGKTPFFNDSADGVAKDCDTLIEACRMVYGYEPDSSKTVFSSSGFYKLYDGDAALVFFVGEPGPSYTLGHAHCDLLSFELSIGGKPIIVNSGTYAYQSELRSYFRSTAAHNTASINDEEQMEYWAEHRVARCMRKACAKKTEEHCIVASFANYKGHIHKRKIELDNGMLSVEDSFDCQTENMKIFLHFAPDFAGNARNIACSCPFSVSKFAYSPLFGVCCDNGILLTFVSDYAKASFELNLLEAAQ